MVDNPPKHLSPYPYLSSPYCDNYYNSAMAFQPDDSRHQQHQTRNNFNNQPEKKLDEKNSSRNCSQISFFIVTLILLLVAIVLSVVAIFDPSWQVVDIPEFKAEHYHGLTTDCTRTKIFGMGRPVSGTFRTEFAVPSSASISGDRSPLHCTYKFDVNALHNIEAQSREINSNAAAAESEHHQFHGWQKAVLIFIGLSLCASTLSLLSSLCASCSLTWAILLCVFTFFAFLFSITASLVFIFAAHRVDSRFVQGLVSTYEQQIGGAFYFYLGSCVLLAVVLILAIIGTYNFTRRISAEQQRQRYQNQQQQLRRQQHQQQFGDPTGSVPSYLRHTGGGELAPLYRHDHQMLSSESGCPSGGFNMWRSAV